jgi:hypothetical protein
MPYILQYKIKILFRKDRICSANRSQAAGNVFEQGDTK